ncbi:PIG-L domain-containing protein [Bordetella petrii]|nr:PIG-L domain-containing protein [Bordetella petrii]
MKQDNLLVVAAHIGDFVWRCGGAVALHARQGVNVEILCLSAGARGESGPLWKSAEATLESVTQQRREEARAAAAVLGATVTFLDYADWPLPQGSEISYHIAEAYRRLQPKVVLTHSVNDPANLDHARTHTMALEARMIALAPGHDRRIISNPQFYAFEPHQSELCDFKPNVLLDISEVWHLKKQAMECLPTQQNLWGYYESLATQRGSHAGRRAGEAVAKAEAFQRLFPQVASTLL